jgi:hypothetical protein
MEGWTTLGKRIPWRELRAVALDAIRDAVARGDEPGEVTPRDLLNQAAR